MISSVNVIDPGLRDPSTNVLIAQMLSRRGSEAELSASAAARAWVQRQRDGVMEDHERGADGKDECCDDR